MEDLLLAVAGFGVGVIVGLTGMGGGALMTPLLVLGFGIAPMTAVSSDLLTSLVMKPVGAVVHARRTTIHMHLVGWLCLGSVPAAFGGVLLLQVFGDSDALQKRMSLAIGAALLLAVGSMLAKSLVPRVREPASSSANTGVRIRPLPTLLIGVLGGVIVGMTSVGAGSVMMVLLLAIYPRLTAGQLVGTDLAQAIPLVAAATLAHLLFGEVSFPLAGYLLLGALPGTYLGARLSTTAPDGVVRNALMAVLAFSGLRLLGVGNATLAWCLVTASAALVAWLLVTSGPPAARSSRLQRRRKSEPSTGGDTGVSGHSEQRVRSLLGRVEEHQEVVGAEAITDSRAMALGLFAADDPDVE